MNTVPLHILTQALHALDVAKNTVAAADFMEVSRAHIELRFYLTPILAAQKIEVLAAEDAEFAALRSTLIKEGEHA